MILLSPPMSPFVFGIVSSIVRPGLSHPNLLRAHKPIAKLFRSLILFFIDFCAKQIHASLSLVQFLLEMLHQCHFFYRLALWPD
jgi:hypothetical protein